MNRFYFAVITTAAVLAIAAGAALGLGSAGNGRLAFVADAAGRPQVFTIEPDGTGLRQVTKRPNGAGEYGLTWSADGSSLIYVVSTNRDLMYTSAVDGRGVRRLSPRCSGQCLGDDNPVVTRSGTKIAFERAFGPVVNDNAAIVGIFTTNADGSGLKQLTQKKKRSVTEDHRPTWSPDGRRVAFQRLDRSKSRGAIFVVNANGAHLRQVTPYSLDGANPRWSRDGTRILFNNDEESGSGNPANLYTIRLDGTGLTKLTNYGGTSQAFVDDWSPDGTQIVVHFIGADSVGAAINQLYLLNADGSGAHALTQLNANANPRRAMWGTSG